MKKRGWGERVCHRLGWGFGLWVPLVARVSLACCWLRAWGRVRACAPAESRALPRA